jgi:hypothetical protein
VVVNSSSSIGMIHIILSSQSSAIDKNSTNLDFLFFSHLKVTTFHVIVVLILSSSVVDQLLLSVYSHCSGHELPNRHDNCTVTSLHTLYIVDVSNAILQL